MSEGSTMAAQLVAEGLLAGGEAALIAACFDALKPDHTETGTDLAEPGANSGHGPHAAGLAEAAAAAQRLWFTLDEIDAVAQGIELVQEHVSNSGKRTARIDALARTVCQLVGIARALQGTIETELRLATA